MKFELTEARILDRRKRFLADVEFEDGSRAVAHLANTGRMTNCWTPGAPVRLSHSDNPKRKLAWSVEQVRMDDWICVNTARPNRLVEEALLEGRLPELHFDELQREVRFPDEGRVDFLLDQRVWLEVKNATLLEQGRVLFPDTVTERGLKHLLALQRRVEAGDRAILLLHVGHAGATSVAPAHGIDPAWSSFLLDSDIEVLAYGVHLAADEMRLAARLPFERR